MIFVNNRPFDVSILDTVETMRNKIASSFKTLPEYLYITTVEGKVATGKDYLSKNKHLILEDLRSTINKIESGVNFNPVVKFLSGKRGMGQERVLIQLWLMKNAVLKKTVERGGKDTLIPLGELLKNNGIYPNERDIFQDWDKSEERNLTDNRREKTLTEKVKEQEEENSRYDKVTPTLFDEKFEEEQVILNLKFNIKGISLLEIFNDIVLTPNVPYGTVDNIYKILKDFVPNERWTTSIANTILLKVYTKPEIDDNDYSDFTDIKLSVDEEENLVGRLSIKIKPKNIHTNEILSRVLNVFPKLDIHISNTVEEKVVYWVYFPKLTFNINIMKDLIMIDPLFSSLLNVNDSDKATKKKAGLYIYFNHPRLNGEKVTFRITQRQVEKKSDMAYKKNSKLFPIGSYYVSARIVGRNLKDINRFTKILSKLFSLYTEKENEITTYYRYFIPNFNNVVYTVPERTEEEEELKRKEPNIFINSYVRICPVRPSIVSKQEAIDNYVNNWILFPRSPPVSKNEITYLSDGKNQRYYVCKNKYKFIGVTKNKLENNNKYPYLPCCFKKYQKDKKKYKDYYVDEGEKREEDGGEGEEGEGGGEEGKGVRRVNVVTVSKDIIKTNKMVSKNQFGTIPESLEKLFSILYEKSSFLRKGVKRNKNSFLSCVLEALDPKFSEITNEDEMKAYIYTVREELSRGDICVGGKQEMYEYSIKEIENMIKDVNIYFAPFLFIHILEEIYNVNIYVFSTVQRGTLELLIPKNIQGYYRLAVRKARTLVIYEHFGSESDHATYPQCELITVYDKVSGMTTEKWPDNMSNKIDNIYKKINVDYRLNVLLREVKYGEGVKNIIGQGIDAYGKTRSLLVKHEKWESIVYTSPLPPFIKCSEIELRMDDKKMSRGEYKSLRNILKFREKSQYVNKTGVVINSKWGNVDISMVVDEVMKNVEIVKERPDLIILLKSKESKLERYSRNQKLARYMKEYIYWLFSMYINETKKPITEDKTIEEFAKDTFVMIPEFKYDIEIPKKTFTKNCGFFHNKKLIVNCEEMMKRLVYVLRLGIERDEKKIRTYYLRMGIVEYYATINDFDKHPTQVILEGTNSIDKWIYEMRHKNILSDRVLPEEYIYPYFIKNKLIGEEIYLAQNTDKKNKALWVGYIWGKDGHNIGGVYAKEEELPKEYRYTLYDYISSSEIKKIEIQGEENEYNIVIVEYKVNGISYFTTLLNLGKK